MDALNNDGQRHFLLVGNGPYSNRGCEAIVRGTMAILRHEFGADVRATVASFGPPDEIARQAATETDEQIRHIFLPFPTIPEVRPWSVAWLRRQYWGVHGRLSRSCGLSTLTPNDIGHVSDFSNLNEFLSDVDCALQIGGDNYSLDFGLPIAHMRVDRHLWAQGVPVVLWGASVGPFESHSRFEAEVFRHLREASAICVRESLSYKYLQSHGVAKGLQRVADPAFAMEPAQPEESKVGCLVPEGAIGLNFSPLLTRFVGGADSTSWTGYYAEIVRTVSSETGLPIALIPHVTTRKSNDHALLTEVAARAWNVPNVVCVGDRLSAAETKWIISRCSVFAGARTHATIAAISSMVPTLSFAYSAKAIGLNEDIFGSQEYCVHPKEFSPTTVARRIVSLLENADRVRKHLSSVLPRLRAAAVQAGKALQGPMGEKHISRNCGCRICRFR